MSRRGAAVGCALLAGLLGEFGYALLLLPLMQHYLQFDRHLSASAPGIVLGAYGLARVGAQLPMGYLDDALDGRVAVAIGYLAVLCGGLLLWAPLPLAGLAGAAILFGLGHALADPLVPAALAGAVSADGRGKVMSYLNLAQVAGLAAGLAGGSFLVDFEPAAVCFLMVAVGHALIVPLLVLGAEPFMRGKESTAGNECAGMWRALLSERVIEMFAAMFFLTLALNMVAPNLSLFSVTRLHVPLHVLTLYLIPAVLVGLICLPLGGWLSDRFGRLLPLFAGTMLATVAFASLSRISSPLPAAVAAAVGAAGVTLTMPSSSAALLDLAAPRNRALLLAGMMAVQGLAETLGPVLGGLLTAAGGVALTIGVAGFVNWLAVPAAALFGSARTAAGPGRVVPYTPLTRLISNAHVRAQLWRGGEAVESVAAANAPAGGAHPELNDAGSMARRG